MSVVFCSLQVCGGCVHTNIKHLASRRFKVKFVLDILGGLVLEFCYWDHRRPWMASCWTNNRQHLIYSFRLWSVPLVIIICHQHRSGKLFCVHIHSELMLNYGTHQRTIAVFNVPSLYIALRLCRRRGELTEWWFTRFINLLWKLKAYIRFNMF